MVSKLDLVTFLEQMKEPRNIRRMKTVAVYPDMCEWMEPVRGPSVSEEVILCNVVWEDLLHWKSFWRSLDLFLLLT